MPFSVTWHTILDELDEVPPDATFRTRCLKSHSASKTSKNTDSSSPTVTKTLPFHSNVTNSRPSINVFLSPHSPSILIVSPADAEPYATIFSVHPRFGIDQREGVLKNTDSPTPSSLVDASLTVENQDHETVREEPDLPLYSDSLLLIDALERYEPTDLETMETSELVNLYTLCSDVQRNADDLRQNVRSLLLDRLHHDQPVHGRYGSVQRTRRRNRTLKDDQTVLKQLEDQGIDRGVSPPSTPPKSTRHSKSPTSRSRTSTRSTKASMSARPMSTKSVKNPASKASKTNSLLLRARRPTNSNEKSKISKLASTNSPVSALPAKSTENPLSKEW